VLLFSKVDIRSIVRGHLLTLRDNRFGDAVSYGDLAIFFGLPVVFGLGILFYRFSFRIDAVNGFLNVFSILTGLLLNLLVLVISLAAGKPSQSFNQARRLRLIKEIFANISFAVIVAVLVVCTALGALSYMRSVTGATTGIVATFLLSSLTMNFVLTLLMVLKRMYILLDKELDGTSDQPKAA
jgi:hypothetical protein